MWIPSLCLLASNKKAGQWVLKREKIIEQKIGSVNWRSNHNINNQAANQADREHDKQSKEEAKTDTYLQQKNINSAMMTVYLCYDGE